MPPRNVWAFYDITRHLSIVEITQNAQTFQGGMKLILNICYMYITFMKENLLYTFKLG